MIPAQLSSLTAESPAIRVAIVCEPETTVLADSLERLLAEAKGFTFSRFEYRAESGLKSHVAVFGDPDVVVAALDSFQATKLELFLRRFSGLSRIAQCS
jgi:hypothetical protein